MIAVDHEDCVLAPIRSHKSGAVMTFSTRVLVVASFSALLLGTTACGAGSTSANQSRQIPTATASPSAHATPTKAALTTAGQYAHAIAKQVRSSKRVTVLTERTDTNNLLGRPNGYLSAAVITDVGGDSSDPDPGVSDGATVEMFDSRAGALRRSNYIQGILKDAPILGTEYDYVRGRVLLRVSGELRPSVAAQYKAAFVAADK